MKSLGIYIHIPFCIRKCEYCDFLSFSADEDARARYVKGLVCEIETEAEKYRNYEVESVFIGGGTPSVLKREELESIANAISRNYNIARGAENACEFTVEMNPGSGHAGFFDFLSENPLVNRVSIGLQSANDDELKVLGRIHSYSQFLDTFERVRMSGIDNINVDLISAVPGQSEKSFMESLERTLSLKPEHISVYSLIIEEGTPFFERYENGTLELPDETAERSMYHNASDLLKREGFVHYEISNFARPGYRCRHNLRYWERGDYAGFGIGAASLVGNRRWRNTSDIDLYIRTFCARHLFNKNVPEEGSVRRDEQLLDRNECMEEFIFLGLRKIEGISQEAFYDTFKVDINARYGRIIQKMISRGLLEKNGDFIRLTRRGIDISNTVMCEFIGE